MLVRFVTNWIDPGSGEAAGLFMALHRMRERADLPARDRSELRDLERWFDAHLDSPSRLRRSRRPHRPDKAISWFRASATLHIARAGEIARVLERNGVPISRLETDRPGYVVYEDELQVVAEPFRDTNRRAGLARGESQRPPFRCSSSKNRRVCQ